MKRYKHRDTGVIACVSDAKKMDDVWLKLDDVLLSIDSYTVAQLDEIAKDNKIDLSNAKNKTEKYNAIKDVIG